MAATVRRQWVGQKRADLQRMKRLCESLLNWNARDYIPPFLTPAQVIIVNSMLTNVVAVNLAQTKP